MEMLPPLSILAPVPMSAGYVPSRMEVTSRCRGPRLSLQRFFFAQNFGTTKWASLHSDCMFYTPSSSIVFDFQFMLWRSASSPRFHHISPRILRPSSDWVPIVIVRLNVTSFNIVSLYYSVKVGFSTVYKATYLGASVAIKELAPSTSSKASIAHHTATCPQMLMNEIAVSRLITLQTICSIYLQI